MKKLMFAAVASLCASVFAEDIASDIVGYQTKDIGKFNITATTFVKTGGGEDWTLGDITPNASWKELGDIIQTFTAEGEADEAYVYVTPASAAEYEIEAGWYKLTDPDCTTPMNDVSIPYTSGYVAKSNSSGAALVFAGQVKKGDVEIPVGKFTMTSNVTPIDRKLGDVVPNANWKELGDLIQTFTAEGEADEAYVYLTTASAAEYEIEAGWYKLTDPDCTTPMNGVDVFSGAGFVAKSNSTGATIKLPKAL